MLAEDIFESDPISDIIQEVAPTRKKVVRKGRVVRKKDCPPGYRLVGGSRCQRISGARRAKLRRAGKRAARKGKAKRRISRKRSLRVRKRRKLKRRKFR